MNLVVLMGRLTKDPNVTYTQGAEPMCIARYTLAVDRRGKKQEGQPTADFISCVAFKNNAEFVEKYLRQGTKIAVVGHIQTGSYTNQEGQKVYTTDVIVDEVEFAESKRGDVTQPPASNQASNQASTSPAVVTASDGFVNIPDAIDEDEVPFG